MSDLYNLKPSQIVLYGTSWCNDCRRARKVFVDKSKSYLDVDIDADPQAAEFVMKLAKGFRSVPTIVFPDGTVMIEPPSTQLAAKLS